MKVIITFLVTFMLFGCASDKEYKEYTAYLAAQQDANRQAAAEQKPLVRLVAQDGQAITGLHSLEVFTPTAAPVIQQARPNEWVSVWQTALGVTGTVLGIRAAGQAAVGLADSVGRAGTAGYQYIQAPGAVSTTTTTSTVGNNSGANSGNSGRIAGTSITDSTSAPTVVTQPATTVVNQPAPVIVTQPAPVVVQQPPGQICTVNAAGILVCI